MFGVRIAALAFGAFIAAAIVAANTGFIHPGHALVRNLPFGDKVSHMVLFGGLALVSNLALGCRTMRLGGGNVLVGSVAVTAFVIVEELSQGFLANRSLDGSDLAADLVGIIIATLAAARIHRELFPDRAPSSIEPGLS